MPTVQASGHAIQVRLLVKKYKLRFLALKMHSYLLEYVLSSISLLRKLPGVNTATMSHSNFCKFWETPD